MTYDETIQFLYQSTPVFEHVGAAAYKPGLANTLALDRHYGHPHRQFECIHVAGTNGKGSVSHSLAAILQQKGLKVGLYTSPHLVDFCERIRIDGQPIEKQYVVDFVEDFISWNNPQDADAPNRQPRLYPSFFELTTALAFRYFADKAIDVAVIEVGLGGRLDCTNIVKPVLSVITNISLDHTNLLGNTLAEIATEKAGIIKQETPVVVGETTKETKAVFTEKARQMQAPIFFADAFNAESDYDFQLKGSYQARNLRTILCATAHLPQRLQPSEAELQQALAHVCDLTGLQGRWQTIGHRPTVVCDTGHNLAAWQYLSKQIQTLTSEKLHIVFGMVDDKDIDGVLALLPKDARYYWTQAHTHRAIPAEKVMELAAGHGLKGQSFTTVRQAYSAARSNAGSADAIFIGGSSYVVADLLTDLKEV